MLKDVKTKAWLRLLARLAGWALSLAAVAFFIRLVMRNGLSVPLHNGWDIAGVTLASAVLYGCAVAFMGLLWSLLLRPPHQALDATRTRLVVAGYMKGMFAKYLPGNVFHYAARHALGRQLGISHAHLTTAAAVEIMMQLGASSFIIVLMGQPVLEQLLPGLPRVPPWLALLIPTVAVAIASLPRPSKLRWFPRLPVLRMAAAFCGYVGFYVMFGGLFTGLLTWASGTPADPTRVIPTASLAWLVGFVVPGAPAGAGLREAALALANGERHASQATLAAIMLFRLATMGGDFLAFAASWLLSLRRQVLVPTSADPPAAPHDPSHSEPT